MAASDDTVWQIKAAAFGRYLRHLRELQDRKQHEVARDAGVTHSYISKLERGQQPDITYRMLERIAAALGKTADALIVEGGLVETQRPDAAPEAEEKALLMDDIAGMSAEHLASLRRAVRELRRAFDTAARDTEAPDPPGSNGGTPTAAAPSTDR